MHRLRAPTGNGARCSTTLYSLLNVMLIHVCLAGSAVICSTTISADASLRDLASQLHAESGPQIRRSFFGSTAGTSDEAADPDSWRFQRCLQVAANAEWDDDSWKRHSVATGLLPGDMTVGMALESESLAAEPIDHLVKPMLRLVHAGSAVRVTVHNVPGVPDGSDRVVYLTSMMSTSYAIDCLIDEFGVRKVVVVGHRASRVHFALEVNSTSASPTALAPSSRVLSELDRRNLVNEPRSLRFTVAASWLAKAGTIAAAFTTTKRGHSRSIQSDTSDDASRLGPSAGGGTGSEAAAVAEGKDSATLRRADPASIARPSRLSALFYDWLTPVTATSLANPARSRPISVVLAEDPGEAPPDKGSAAEASSGEVDGALEEMMVSGSTG